jgi:uncharacterized protein YebE (UPF0316 family)
MKEFFESTAGVSDELFSFVILPSLIFVARICEMTVNTLRIIYMLGGRRYTAALLGFFEAFIWLVAMRQIFEHLDNWLCYVAYPGGFAAGIFIGMKIEERIAYGKVIIRIITRKNTDILLEFLRGRDFRFTSVDAHGPDGSENLVFTVIKREHLDALLHELSLILPTAFYTVENVKAAGENAMLPVNRTRFNLLTWLQGVVRY